MDRQEITFALAIPHTPWIAARVESMSRLLCQLDPMPAQRRIFSDREPNWSWSEKLWTWGASQSATHLVQLQDDVIVSPDFWAILTAMVSQASQCVIGLQGAHPKFRQLAREGHHWAQSFAWMVGVGWIMPRDVVRELLEHRASLSTDSVRRTNEDDLIAAFCMATDRQILHPIPTIIDHDTEIESTYGNGNHAFRRPTVTWRDYGAELIREEFWRVPNEIPPVTNPHMQRCWFCEDEPSAVGFSRTGALIGARCLSQGSAALLTRKVKRD